jgi:hypothetical protein
MPLLLGFLKFIAQLIIPLIIQEYFKERSEKRKEAKEDDQKNIGEEKVDEILENNKSKIMDASPNDLADLGNALLKEPGGNSGDPKK